MLIWNLKNLPLNIGRAKTILLRYKLCAQHKNCIQHMICTILFRMCWNRPSKKYVNNISSLYWYRYCFVIRVPLGDFFFLKVHKITYNYLYIGCAISVHWCIILNCVYSTSSVSLNTSYTIISTPFQFYHLKISWPI